MPNFSCRQPKGWAALAAVVLASGCASTRAEHEEPATDQVGGGVRLTVEGSVGHSQHADPAVGAPAAVPAGPWYANAPGGPSNPPPGNSGFLQTGPAIAGTHLNLMPGQTATERALELAQKLNAADGENESLTHRIQELEVAVDDREKAIRQASEEIRATREELAEAREEIEQRTKDLAALRQKLRDADEENAIALETALTLLQQFEGRFEAADQSRTPAGAKSPKTKQPPARVGQK